MEERIGYKEEMQKYSPDKQWWCEESQSSTMVETGKKRVKNF